ncbi:hypothetical protein PTSG_00053 [Salpingoeca rosetta]|uniref:Uncharacterized protein n=1 Tax=Salpingoeca rosetta (strain ATCC 50818 / BSB-021) TaxID=946362 RepID=F2TVE0_SALR5|nr:uncharacterized protein PTSG_00053 [Salpingoeca rosetta]EGD72036.1 hypothetical protein PTSG_00053 [Salpingoeca rosetta]|eukprot:XP_004998608.1 hypothetical protein PTSG_00053 [Salpingoeca rosetta]
MAEVRTLPAFSVQHDWQVDVHNPAEAQPFWLAIRPYGADRSYHGKCKVNRDGTLHGTDGYDVHKLGENTLAIKHEAFADTTWHISCPVKEDKAPFNGKPLSVDVSPAGDLLVCSGTNGSAAILNTSDLKPLRHLKGHKGDVHTCRFFPSGEVVLTAGADWRARIWSAVDSSNPVSFTHAGAVRDVAIVDRGRNVLSAAMDGRVRLWDCGTAACLHSFEMDANPTAIALLTCPDIVSSNVERVIHEREAGTEGRVVVAASLSRITLIDLRAQHALSSVQVPKPSALCAFDDVHFASGHENGHISLWDCRKFSEPVVTVSRWEAPVTALTRAPVTVASRGAVVGAADGSCFVLDVDSLQTHELSGSNLDPIACVCATPQSVVAAAADSRLRTYTFGAIARPAA